MGLGTTWYNTWLKARALHDLGENKEAYKLAKSAQEMGMENEERFFYKDDVAAALAEWPKR